MKRLITLLLVSVFLMAALPLPGSADNLTSLQGLSSPLSAGFTFYGIYERIIGTESLDETSILHAVMSGDGQKLAIANYHFVYTVNADGSSLATFPEPALSGGIRSLTINQDGSRVFFAAQVGGYRLYKLENGAITEILNAGVYDEIASIEQIQTTADGEYVYFLDDGVNDNDVWRVNHSGLPPTKVIEDRAVIHSGFPGSQVKEFAISANASTIAFALFAYWDPAYHPDEELFVLKGGAYQQITNRPSGSINNIAISGDGNTMVYGDGSTSRRYAIRSDGSNPMDLEHLGYNTAGPDLTYDGARMFYNDSAANGGRLTNTNGSDRLDLFPGYPISLAATYNPRISDNGSRIAFVHSEGYYQDGLYVGYLNLPGAAPDAPQIHSIAFNPAAMPRNNPAARVTLTSQISDPQGLGDIQKIATKQLLSGVLASGYGDCPAYFQYSAKDEGTSPDVTAGDGIFSSLGQPGSQIDTLDQVTIRMGAQDSSSVVVADTILFMGNPGQMPLLPPINLQVKSGLASIALSWDPSPSPSVVGYNIYRSAALAGPWELINTALVSGNNYLDMSDLITGATYFYYVTALDGATSHILSLESESVPSKIVFTTFGLLKFFLPDSYGASGEQVRLPVSIANANRLEMCAVDIAVTYDPTVLSAADVESTALSAAYIWSHDFSTPGVARATIAASSGETLYGEGALFQVLFNVVGSSGETSGLAFQASGSSFYDCDDLINPVALELSAVGHFTVQAGFIQGDLDGDGLVTAADADLALEIAVGKRMPSPEQQAAGDLNGDGRVNAADAALIMRLAAGLPLVPSVQANILNLSASEAVTISAPSDAKLPGGGSEWVDISISNAGGLAGVDLVLNYDPFITTVVGVRATLLSSHFDVAFHVLAAGQARISLKPQAGYEDGLKDGSGALVAVQFAAVPSTRVEDVTPLNLASVSLYDRYGRDFASSALQVPVNAVSGLLSVICALFFPVVVR